MSNEAVLTALILILVIVVSKGLITLAIHAGATPLNFVDATIGIVTLVAGANVAHLVGPYAAIFVAACGGAIMALCGDDKNRTILQAVWYVTGRVVLAWALTVTIAELVQLGAASMHPKYTLMPIALAIGYIRNKKHLLEIKAQVIEIATFFRKKA